MKYFSSSPNTSLIFRYVIFTITFCYANINIKKTEAISSNGDAKSVETFNLGIKASIFQWWKKHDVPKVIKCNHKIPSLYKNNLLNLVARTEIKSFPCKEDEPFYYFKGFSTNGNVIGNGKLTFLNETEWSKLTENERAEIENRNICFNLPTLGGVNISEIIGTFKNGFLQGKSKVTYRDNFFSISTYKNGHLHGYHRCFNPQGILISVGIYDRGWKIGPHWKYIDGHLLYLDETIIRDKTAPTLIFSISQNGTLNDPISGNYFPLSGALENVYKSKVLSVTTNDSDCVLDIKYKVLGKENYTYSLYSKSIVPISRNNNKFLCQNTSSKKSSYTVAEKIINWFSLIDNTLRPKKVEWGTTIQMGHEILWQLRPESEEPDIQKSKRLISNIYLNPETKSMKARILGSIPVKIQFDGEHVKLDTENQLNGYNDINVATEHQKYIPKDTTLGWVPIRIAGKFTHGYLSGYVMVQTSVSSFVWVSVKNGIMHGPCVVYGIANLIDLVS